MRSWEHCLTPKSFTVLSNRSELPLSSQNLQNLRFYLFKLLSHCFSNCCSQIFILPQTKKKKSRPLLSFPPHEIINFGCYFILMHLFLILKGKLPLRHKAFYKAALNELCNMKRCCCLLERLIFISLENWMDFCFFVRRLCVPLCFSVHRPIFPFEGYCFSFCQRNVSPPQRLDSWITGQRSGKLSALSSESTHKQTQGHTDTRTQHHNTNKASSASSLCLFLMTWLLWRSACVCVHFKDFKYPSGK